MKSSYSKMKCFLLLLPAGTFDIIIKNVTQFLAECTDAKVDFRINLDNNNKNEYIPLHRYLTTSFKDHKIGIYPGILRANPGCESETFFSSEDHLNFIKELSANDFNNQYPYHSPKGCCACAISSHVIGPLGEIYLCWEHVGLRDKVIGYIDGASSGNSNLLTQYMLKGNCFGDEKCLACPMIPICSGGCSYKRMQNISEGTSHNLCTIYKDNDGKNLEELLCLYYMSINKNECTKSGATKN